MRKEVEWCVMRKTSKGQPISSSHLWITSPCCTIANESPLVVWNFLMEPFLVCCPMIEMVEGALERYLRVWRKAEEIWCKARG
jgi:hypothetical protein